MGGQRSDAEAASGLWKHSRGVWSTYIWRQISQDAPPQRSGGSSASFLHVCDAVAVCRFSCFCEVLHSLVRRPEIGKTRPLEGKKQPHGLKLSDKRDVFRHSGAKINRSETTRGRHPPHRCSTLFPSLDGVSWRLGLNRYCLLAGGCALLPRSNDRPIIDICRQLTPLY